MVRDGGVLVSGHKLSGSATRNVSVGKDFCKPRSTPLCSQFKTSRLPAEIVPILDGFPSVDSVLAFLITIPKSLEERVLFRFLPDPAASVDANATDRCFLRSDSEICRIFSRVKFFCDRSDEDVDELIVEDGFGDRSDDAVADDVASNSGRLSIAFLFSFCFSSYAETQVNWSLAVKTASFFTRIKKLRK